MVVRRNERRRAIVAVTAAAVGALLASATGCTEGGAAADDKPGSGGTAAAARRPAGAAVRAAADGLKRAGTSRVRTSVLTASGGTRVSLDGTGAFDYRKDVGRLTVRLPEGAAGARAGERREVREIAVPDALFMKNRGAGVPAGKWVRVDTTALPDGNLVASGATDPASAAGLLRGARRVAYQGTDEVDGERLRHYRGVVDLRAAARRAEADRRRQLAAAARGFSHATVPFDVHLDGRGRLRMVRLQFTFASGTGSGGGGAAGDASSAGGGKNGGKSPRDAGMPVLSTVRLGGFGTPVRVVMPRRSEIYTGRIAAP